MDPNNPQATYPIPPPLAVIPIGRIDPSNPTSVMPDLQFLKFLQNLWAANQGDGGLIPRVTVLEQEVAIIFGMYGDGTLSNAGVLTVTKTNGVPFAYFATGTDASHLTGTLDPARIANNSLPYAKLLNAASPSLLGAGVAGAIGSVSIGTGLALSALNVLTATANPLATRQVLTSGTAATYTTPANCRQLRIRMVGGGGGGCGTSAVARFSGVQGGTTTFNSINAIGGAPGTIFGQQGGYASTPGTGTASFRAIGNAGESGTGTATLTANSGAGGGSVFGAGAGATAQGVTQSGKSAQANTGAGGSGSCDNSGTPVIAGGGGQAGEYVEIIISSPAATYTYTIGGGGLGGTGGTQSGGAGGSGVIIVDEYY
jgi:hypothetical protein